MPKIFIFAFFLLVLVLRIFLHHLNLPKFADNTIVRLSGTVNQDPIFYERSQRVILKGIKVYLPLYPVISYKDYLVVEGKISKGKLTQAKVIEHKKSDSFLSSFRRALLDVYKKVLPSDFAGLIAGVSLGSKLLISNELYDKLIRTGTVHVVVASGMNITLITRFVLSFLAGVLNRKTAIIVACIFAWGYAFLVGFEAPIVRAVLMSTFAFSALELGRLSESIRVLFATGFIMLFIKPDWVYDVGFYLSFASTLSLVVFYKSVYDRLIFVPLIFRENFASSLVAQFGVTPILVYLFGGVNIISPVINALILWTVVPMTIIGLFGGVVGMVNTFIGTYILYLVVPLASIFLSVLDLFS